MQIRPAIAHRGGGVGRELGAYALAWARDAGFAAMQFNAVVETNTAAVVLWQQLASKSSPPGRTRSTTVDPDGLVYT